MNTIFYEIKKRLSLFIRFYIANHVIAHIPSYLIRHFYYRTICRIKLGKRSSLHMGLFITGYDISIGDHSAISRHCYLDGRGPLTIGNNVSIASDVKIITASHEIDSPDFKPIQKPIFIKDHAWICTGSIILPGVTIGKGAVVATGSVVTKDVPDYAVVGGVPAKFIKERAKDLNYNCDWFLAFD